MKSTNITQPALFVHSYILTCLLGDKLRADVTAGHSLGEYTSNAYANTFSFEEGLKLVKKRGELMKNSGEIQKGTMAALIGMTENQIEEICKLASTKGIVQAANFNCPGQIVVSGDVIAVEEAMTIAKAEPFKCRLAKRLEVSGAFHSELMRSSDKELRNALDAANIKNSEIPIYTNVSGMPIYASEDIRSALKVQLTSPVRWEISIRNMLANGVTKFYEIGSGKVLTGLVKKINPETEVFNISTYEDLSNL